MKEGIIALFILVVAALSGGCVSVEKAFQAAEASRKAAEKAGEELRDAYDVMAEAATRLKQAQDSGEVSQVEAAIEAFTEARKAAEKKQLEFDATKEAFQVAKGELEKAQSVEDYLLMIPALLFGGLLGGGTGFGIGRKRRSRKQTE